MNWTAIWTWITAHSLSIFFVIAVAVEQLPPPTAQTGGFYRWLYATLQFLVANWRRSRDAVVPPKTP